MKSKKEGKSNSDESMIQNLVQNVLSNPLVWCLAFCYFAIYIVRSGVTNWTVFFLMNAKVCNGFTFDHRWFVSLKEVFLVRA